MTLRSYVLGIPKTLPEDLFHRGQSSFCDFSYRAAQERRCRSCAKNVRHSVPQKRKNFASCNFVIQP
jgi:hypothetical protein